MSVNYSLSLPTSKYTYSPLSKTNSIRVLIIESGSWPSPISCQLQERSPSDSPLISYEALSYTWGHDDPKNPIIIDGHTFLVRDNLFHALRHLRCSNTSRTIWIDALCINQEKTSERNQQVRHMPDVYSGAQRTLVWLKEKEQEDGAVIEALRLIEPVLHMPKEEREDRISVLETRILNKQEANGIPQSLHHLLTMSWFRRVWVIQEFSLSAEIIFMVGQETFSAEALDQLQHIVMKTELGNRECSFYTLFSAMVPLRTLLLTRSDKQNARETKFSEVFHMTSNGYQASNPKDRIFALYGLCDTKDIPCAVDYDLDVRDVFCSATKWCMGNTEIVEDTLGLTIEHPSQTGWPSWVPDVAASARTMTSYVRNHFSAGGLGIARTEAMTNGTTLTLNAGRIVDIIDHVYDLDMPGILDLSWDRRDAIKNIVMSIKPNYPTGEDLAHVLWRLLIADTVRIGSEKDTQSPQAACGDEYLDPRILDYSFEDTGSDDGADDPLDASRTAYLELMIPQELVRLCRTRNGYLGWVGPDVQAGDQICVFRGFTAPWVLRGIGTGDSYRLNGSAYVHGIMYGEATLSEGFEWHEISLC